MGRRAGSQPHGPVMVPIEDAHVNTWLDVQHLIPHQVRDAVLANFTAGTVLESAKGGPLILGYDCDDMPTLDALTEFFATQGLPAALTE